MTASNTWEASKWSLTGKHSKSLINTHLDVQLIPPRSRHHNIPSSRPENLIYLLSLALATFSLVFAIYPQFLFVYANVAAFAITVPYHTALFLAQRHPAPRRRAPWSFVLLAMWIFVVGIDMLAGAPHPALPFQIVVSTVFGGLECVVVAYIAFRCVTEESNVGEGQVQLPFGNPIVVYR
jgi:hypothetical protein